MHPGTVLRASLPVSFSFTGSDAHVDEYQIWRVLLAVGCGVNHSTYHLLVLVLLMKLAEGPSRWNECMT